MFRALSLCLALAATAAAAEPANPLVALTYSGDPQPLATLDQEIGAAGTDAARLAAIEQRLLAVLRQADATYAARQAAAQRLGWVLGTGTPRSEADAYKPLAAMLVDDRDSDLARSALEAAAGPAVDGLFVAAVEKASGRARLGLIDSLGRRRQASAVPALSRLLKDTDEATSIAAARALGEIADPAAAAALHAFPEPSPAPIAAAKLAAARRMPVAPAVLLLNELQQTARDPLHRAAALRLALDLETGSAAARIAEALAGSSWDLKSVALEAIASSRAPNLVATLAARLPDFDAASQRAVIAALERRSDGTAALPAITRALRHADTEVRATAIGALGVLPGTPETVALLTGLIQSDGEQARLARQSLARLNGPGVNAAVLAGAEAGAPAARAVLLEQIALRNQTEGLPLLLKQRVDPSPLVRAAAVAALGDLAPPVQQKALLDWAIEAADATEQTRSLAALVKVTLRNPNAEQRNRPVLALIEFALPDLALRLLPVLNRLGGADSAACAAQLAVRDDARLAEAATAALGRWSDAAALPALVTVAEKAAQPAAREGARAAFLRHFERHRSPWEPDTTALVGRMLASIQETDTRIALVRLLHRARDREALTLLGLLRDDPALLAAVTAASSVVAANLAGPPLVRASKSAGTGNLVDQKTSTRWNTALLGEEWIEVDYRLSRPFNRLILDQTGRTGEFPERYEIHVTEDPAQPGPALAAGPGQRGSQTAIDLPASTAGRYLLIRNTVARPDSQWSVSEVYVD